MTMADAPETLAHALALYECVQERIEELEKAMGALSSENQFRSSAFGIMSISQGTAWTVEIPATLEFVGPFFDAALTKEHENARNMLARLEAARTAMQQKP